MAKKRKAKKSTHRGTKKKSVKKSGKKGTTKKKPTKKQPAQKKPARKKLPTQKRRASSKKKSALGRPRVTGEEKLYLLFKEDFHARQIFSFLRVETVRELEEFSAKDIVKLLSQPIRKTVDRIRRKLAEKNRYLLDDEEFALLQKADRQ